MTNRRTNPVPGAVLIAVPAIVWFALICVISVFAAVDRPAPFGGFWTVGIGLAITSTLSSLGVWALDSAKAHVSAEFATYYGMWCHRADSQVTQPILRAVGTAMVAVTAEAPQPLPDNVRSFELGRQVGRRENHNG